MSWVIDQVTEHGPESRNFPLMLGREKKDKIMPSDFLKPFTYTVLQTFLKGKKEYIWHWKKKGHWYIHRISLEEYPRN